MRHARFLLLALPLLGFGGCSDEAATPPTGTAGAGAVGGGGGAGGATTGGGGAGGEAPSCDSAEGSFPAGLEEIAWDDGGDVTSVREQRWAIEVEGTEYVLNEEPLHEAARFDLEHPARVFGFRVRWASPPSSPDAPLRAGLYADFGHNGFDFWEPDPLWEGTRCTGALDEEGWVDYVFEAPVEIDHPGLVYVAHRAEPGEPVFALDLTSNGDGTCALFDECHSSFNLPNAAKPSFFNGVSFPTGFDFAVRLLVEYEVDVLPGETLFQEQPFDASGHASFGDFDHDGYDDLVTEGPKLYRNDGDGTFTDVTAAAGIAALGVSGTGGVWGDYDNDGCLDLLVYAESHVTADTLLKNDCDGTFTDVTAAAGIVDFQTYDDCGDPANVRSPTAAAAFLDLDADGFLDIYQANFICWGAYTYYLDAIWHNLGDGTFESWATGHGFAMTGTPSRGAAPVDADRDGDVDLFVNNYVLKQNLYFQNQGDGTVLQVGGPLGVAGHANGLYYGHTIGAAWGDLDDDGDFDLVAANLAHPRFFHFSDKTQVLLQGSDGVFTDITGSWDAPASAAGLRFQETHSVPALADFDQDGHLDMIITAVYDGRPTDFYWGNGDGTFTLDAYHAGITTRNGWGVALSDLDNDGDVDAFAHRPFVNSIPAADLGHFLQVRVIGNAGSNWAALGSTVEIMLAGAPRIRHVQGGTGKGGQDSQYLHFGLGAETTVDSVQVTFPGGKVVTYPGPFAADQRLWLFEDGGVATGWAPP